MQALRVAVAGLALALPGDGPALLDRRANGLAGPPGAEAGKRAARPTVDARALAAVVQQALRAWNVPGVAVAVVRGDEVVYLKGHGVREVGKKGPVTPDTLFPIASCTKAFTTTAVAILVDEGKMGWDDPVRKHLPWFHLGDALADREVRLRDLMCHRTGLAGHNLLWYRSSWSPEEVVRRSGKLPLDRPFRTAFQYNSPMFTAAGLAVAAAADTPWDEFIHKRLFEPLGMTGAVCTTTAALKSADLASPHVLGRSGRPEGMERYVMRVPDPAGSVHASARDLARWLRFQMGDGTAGKRRLVSAAALAETHKPHVVIRSRPAERELFPDTVQIGYGLGWVIYDHRGRRLVSHGGAIDGFRAHFTLVPEEKLALVLLCNLHDTHMNLALSNSLLDVLLGLPKKDWNALHQAVLVRAARAGAERERAALAKRHHGTRPSREPAAYAGEYEHPAYGTVKVTVGGGALGWRWNDCRATLEHFHYDTFTLAAEPVGPARVTFALGASGAVERMRVGGQLDVEFRKVPARAGAKP
jgi:CubicO group peptidase (beta-lactamase class C family)